MVLCSIPAPWQEDVTNELIRTFETSDDDVFVCTFAKSGTTWVQQIITLVSLVWIQERTACLLVLPGNSVL